MTTSEQDRKGEDAGFNPRGREPNQVHLRGVDESFIFCLDGSKVVPALVEVEVAVLRPTPHLRYALGDRQVDPRQGPL